MQLLVGSTAWLIAFPCLFAWFLVLSGSNHCIFLIPTHYDKGLESISNLTAPYGAYGHVRQRGHDKKEGRQMMFTALTWDPNHSRRDLAITEKLTVAPIGQEIPHLLCHPNIFYCIPHKYSPPAPHSQTPSVCVLRLLY